MADKALEKKKKSNEPGFFKGVGIEFRKVSWPNRFMVSKQTVAVVVVTVVLGAIIAVLDLAMQYGINFITM